MKLRWFYAIALTATALLTGCASVREVNSTVQSYSTLETLPTPPAYKLELLPSQKDEIHFGAIEAQAQQALARVGLVRDDSQARLVVQISAVARYARDYASWPYYSSPWGPRFGFGMGFGRGVGWGFGGSAMFDGPPLDEYLAVSVGMRDLNKKKLVY